jgi:hypothetical protein
MGILNNIRQIRLLKSATKKVQSGGEISGAVDDIYKYYNTDETFARILDQFKATPQDIASIILGCMAAGAGGTYRGHYVPVSAVLYPDTLAYMLRALRGQVPKGEAYHSVMDYFESGAIVFQPERAVPHS